VNYIKGKNKTRAFEDKQGIKRYVTEIVGERVLMLDKKES
jgi:single-strand DNA-binding protein